MINNNRNSHVIFVWALNCTSTLILCNDYPNKRPMCDSLENSISLIHSKVTEKKPRSEPPSPPLSGQAKFSLDPPPPGKFTLPDPRIRPMLQCNVKRDNWFLQAFFEFFFSLVVLFLISLFNYCYQKWERRIERNGTWRKGERCWKITHCELNQFIILCSQCFAKENFTTISGNHGYSKAPGKSNFDSIYKRYSLYLEV